MKYVVFYALLNIHTGDLVTMGPDEPYKEYTAGACLAALIKKPIEKPNANGEIKVYECVVPNAAGRQTVQFTQVM